MPAAKEMREVEGTEMVHCIYRVAELPVVAAVFDGVCGVYQNVKHAPVPLLGRTLDAAEATVRYAVAQAYPVALKCERPIEYIDSLACKGLDVLEHNVPLMKKTPDQILAVAKSYMTETAQVPINVVTRVKSYGVAKVDAVADYGRDKVIQAAKTTYGQRALRGMDAAVTVADSYVDKYIPDQESEDKQVPAMNGLECEENWDPALAPIAHAAALTAKLRRRIYKLTLAKAHAAQKACTDALDHVPIHPAGFVGYVCAQLASGSHTVTDKTKAIWEETIYITPGRVAQAVTTGMNAIEARTYLAASQLLQYLKGNYAVEQESIKDEF